MRRDCGAATFTSQATATAITNLAAPFASSACAASWDPSAAAAYAWPTTSDMATSTLPSTITAAYRAHACSDRASYSGSAVVNGHRSYKHAAGTWNCSHGHRRVLGPFSIVRHDRRTTDARRIGCADAGGCNDGCPWVLCAWHYHLGLDCRTTRRSRQTTKGQEGLCRRRY